MAASRLWAVNPYTKHYPILMQVKTRQHQPDAGRIRPRDRLYPAPAHPPGDQQRCLPVHNKPYITGEVHNWMARFAGFNMPMPDGTTLCILPLRITAHGRLPQDARRHRRYPRRPGTQIVCEVVKYPIGVPLASLAKSMASTPPTARRADLRPSPYR